MIQFACDASTCDIVLTEDQGRIALELLVPATEDDIDLIPVFGFTGSHHFCSMACLSGWAMDRAIEGD